jgi:hypothetical protein
MEITGLPLHALIVHATVVLVPLVALISIGFAVLPRWRWLSRWPSVVGAVLLVPLVFLTVKSGQALEQQRHLVPLMKVHAARGHLLYDMIIVFAVLMVVAAFVLPGPSALVSGRGAVVRRVVYVDKVVAVLVVLGALAVIVQCVLTGDAAARVLWG